MSDSLIFILELIGTVSFAVSGAMSALKKGMDIFGVAILGLTTAVGGGIIRDIILGNTPPNTFRNPVYALVAIATAIVMFFPGVRRFLGKRQKAYDLLLLAMDSVGLGIFTLVGIQVALRVYPEAGSFLLIFVGVLTGVGGGVMRDMMSRSMPYIFVKHFYACASLIGAVIYLVTLYFFGDIAATLCGAGSVILLRFLAAHYRWQLPRAAM